MTWRAFQSLMHSSAQTKATYLNESQNPSNMIITIFLAKKWTSVQNKKLDQFSPLVPSSTHIEQNSGVLGDTVDKKVITTINQERTPLD